MTFDNFVPDDDPDPEVMQINVIEVETDNGVNANQYLDLTVDPDEFIGKKVLAVPRCCQKRKGTTDRMRANDNVERRLRRLSWEEFVERCLKKGSNKVPETLNPAKS